MWGKTVCEGKFLVNRSSFYLKYYCEYCDFYILKEIEEKAPLLKKQREDYETALTSIEQMTSQLDSTMLVRSLVFKA